MSCRTCLSNDLTGKLVSCSLLSQCDRIVHFLRFMNGHEGIIAFSMVFQDHGQDFRRNQGFQIAICDIDETMQSPRMMTPLSVNPYWVK